MATVEELRDEHRRVRRVQVIVALASNLIMQAGLSRVEGEAVVAAARDRILDLFPGRDGTYETLYGRRFGRLLDEFTQPSQPSGIARVIPFPARPR
jgi:hypothetical protein